jgi:hypothetical protein
MATVCEKTNETINPKMILKTKLPRLIIMLAWLVSIHSAVAQTSNLSIAPAGNQVLLFWLSAGVQKENSAGVQKETVQRE